MDKPNSLTYDDLVQSKNTQILKSIVPFLDFPSQRPVALLIQMLEWRSANAAFSRRDNRLAACALPDGSDRRSALLAAVRPYCSPAEQETIDTLLNLLCVMDNYDQFSNQ